MSQLPKPILDSFSLRMLDTCEDFPCLFIRSIKQIYLNNPTPHYYNLTVSGFYNSLLINTCRSFLEGLCFNCVQLWVLFPQSPEGSLGSPRIGVTGSREPSGADDGHHTWSPHRTVRALHCCIKSSSPGTAGTFVIGIWGRHHVTFSFSVTG